MKIKGDFIEDMEQLQELYSSRFVHYSTNFQKIKSMSLDEMAEFLNDRNFCELKTPCKECKNKVFCEAETAEDFKKWLEGATL